MFLVPHPFDSPDWVILINIHTWRLTVTYHRNRKSVEAEIEFAI